MYAHDAKGANTGSAGHGFPPLVSAWAPLHIEERQPDEWMREQITRREPNAAAAAESSADTERATPEPDADPDDAPKVERGPVQE